MAQSGLAVEYRVDPRGDIVDRGHAIDRSYQAAIAIVRQDRFGLGAILGHSRAHRRFIVVGPADELGRAAGVAYPGRLGRLELVVIAGAAPGAGEAPGDALDELVLVDLK